MADATLGSEGRRGEQKERKKEGERKRGRQRRESAIINKARTY
jgi:hypothetical protein